jgi:hypothetical protein
MDIEKMKALALARDVIDDEGENRAVRTFLMQYGLPGLTVGAMRNHMSRSGWEGCWPEWVAEAHAGTHLTKAGAQLWLRFLFNLEGAAPAAGTVEKDAKRPDFFKWWTSIETDVRKSMLVWASRDRERLFALMRTTFDAAIEAHTKAGREDA